MFHEFRREKIKRIGQLRRKLFTRKDRFFFSLCLGSLFDYFQVRSMGYFMIEGICEKKKAFEFTNCPCYLDLEYLTNSLIN